ncbi:unnamed protein product [Penicillium nalgiovense]|uniref:Zn(2)-C6 fungal-type domain-containing protein n=1 Tax=Penicillium nalgiovense TaxID=60175 RepID=A0A9W4IMK6_PENNA|nr:unnamed protein product [Penicillium nalgiovense]CAG7939286.1 unnamed protein product [Penicillium nalgiovense]CAG7940559.1 unnamed protein product [Penicillium nalgiovense]CAG7942799.1 unnamed protein product [Penicillium nalgiovense]CAG7952336.1 unnamed protein product [Penicillium nalgiovense]
MASVRASPACGNCRSRRIKCNLLRPRCSQCARAGLDCAGYRPQSDLLFRDQTKSTIQKLHASRTRRTEVNKHTTCWSPVVIKSTFNVEELAQKVFSDNFAILGDECKQWMDSGAENPSSVTVSLTSVGLAALAVVHKDPDMMDLARRKYNFAIRILTKATIGHQSGGFEQSVAGSFILSIFEMITCDRHSPSYAWQKHVHGAAAFLGYLCSTNGLPVSPVKEIIEICYTTVRWYVIRERNVLTTRTFKTLACLISDKTVPHFLLELPGRFGASSNTSQADEGPLLSAMRLFAILGTLVNIRVLAKQNFSPPGQLVEMAIKSDQTLQNWAASLPASWTYQELPKGPQYVYQDVWYARMWNYYRLARILANRIIIDNCDIMSPAMLPDDVFKLQHAQSSAAIPLLSQEIYSSFPFMFKSEQVPVTSLPLSAALFFTTTLLQSLLGLTDRDTLIQVWSSPAFEVLGESFTFTKSIVMQNLYWATLIS